MGVVVKMKYIDKCKRWTPEYGRYIYDQLLEEIELQSRIVIFPPVRKWKRDLLLMMLEGANEKVTRKVLRKQVSKDIFVAEQKGFATLSRSGETSGEELVEEENEITRK